MSCDSYYGIGHKHQVCQDYALHGSMEDMECVIVADGCSGAEYSEIGAQILCHAAKYQVALSYQSGLFHECTLESLSCVLGNSILKRIREVSVSYPISSKALEATLLIVVCTPRKVFVFGWGDGVIIERYRQEDGTVFQAVCDIEFTGNAPYYLVSDRECYLKNMRIKGHDEPKTFHTHYTSSPAGKGSTDWAFPESSLRVVTVVKNEISYGTPYLWETDLRSFCNSLRKQKRELFSITVCTDGIKTFQDENKKPIDLNLIVPEVVEYKATEGEFVKKRMFFLERMARKNNWSHYDDIGCGTILI